MSSPLNFSTMYHKRTGSYDEIPEGMKEYINNYGCHFNKKLYTEAVRRMYKTVNGKRQYAQQYTKEQIDTLLRQQGIQLVNNELYDYMYVAMMCKMDFLGSSIPDEAHLAKYIKDMIDDADAESGLVFNRWYADQVFMNHPIEWEDML